jgi:nicotinate-nucleotide adenylyltransferase
MASFPFVGYGCLSDWLIAFASGVALSGEAPVQGAAKFLTVVSFQSRTRRLHRSSKSFGAIGVPVPPASRGRRIGLMGGSFNPPHAGHRLAAEEALRRLDLDELWWLVTPGNPLKAHAALKPLPQRLHAVQALALHPRMRVTSFEDALRSPFTAVTVDFLVRRYPTVRFVWIMGADNLATFDRWQDWRTIAATVPIAIVDRPGYRMKALASKAARALAQHRVPEAEARTLPFREPPAWVFLTNPLAAHSSSTIRQVADSRN